MATKPHLRADSASRRFQPLPFLNRLYNEEARQRPMPNPRDGAFEQWQKETRKLLHEILAPEYAQQPMKPKRRERADCGDYWRLYYEVETAPDLWVPFFVLTPKDHDGPAPGILCLHGRGYGMNEICGLLEDGNPREGEDPGYQKILRSRRYRRGSSLWFLISSGSADAGTSILKRRSQAPRTAVSTPPCT